MRQDTIRPFLFGCLGVLLAYMGQRALRGDALLDAALLYGAGMLLFVAALRQPAWFPERAFAFPTAALPPLRARRWWLVGALLLAALALAVLSWNSFNADYPSSTVAWWQSIASVTLVLLAAACVDWRSPTGRKQSDDPWSATALPAHPLTVSSSPAWRAAAVLAAILLLAAALRLVQLNSLPFGIWYDEAQHGLQAQRILNDPSYRPVYEPAIGGTAPYLYLVALAFDWFGVSVGSVRLVSALFGVLAVAAGYLLGTELFGRRIGLVLAFLLAVSSWLLTLSRLGMYATTSTPLFTLATLVFLLRSLRTGRMMDFALGGLMLGLGLCFYTSFRLFVPAVGFFLLYCILYQWRRTGTWPAPRFWFGILLLLCTALVTVAPLAWFAYAHPDAFWSRVQETFVFANVDAANWQPVLLQTIQKHLLMFNWRGDPNGRHNLPGSPMLDDIAGVLMVLGLAYSLWRIRDPRYALLPVWLGFTLLAGILSLDFEAPQSLRSNGSLGAAYVLAVVPLAVLVRAWEAGGGRWLRRTIWWPVVLLLAASATANIYVYFVRQANDFAAWAAHSTAETLTANVLAGLDENTDAYVTSFFHGHPTLHFLLPNGPSFARLETTDQFPLKFAPDKGALLVMNADGRAQFESAKVLYPNAQFEEIMPPMPGPPVLYTVRLTPEDVGSIQGLDGSYYANAEWAGPPAIVRRDTALDFDWAGKPPLPEPFSAEWTGVLHVATYGVHDLVLQSPAYAELLIGEQRVLTGTGVLSGSLALAEGNHALRVRAVGGPGIFQLRWLPPDRPVEVIGSGALYAAPMRANGLLARYFPNGDWAEPEVTSRIEDQLGFYVHIPPLPRPYSVEYTGKIAIPVAGDYRFGLESIDESSLAIDGKEIVSATLPNEYVEGSATLEAGLHDIRIRFADRTDHTHLNVYWTPPVNAVTASRALIPGSVLFPPQASYADVQLPTLASIVAPVVGSQTGDTGTQSGAPPAPQLAGAAFVFADGLQQPRGIAVAEDGRVFVAQSGSGKVTVFTPEGEVAGLLPPDAGLFAEPTDLAVDAQNLYVLDSGAGELWRYPLDGSAGERIEIERELADRARGLAVGADGRLWLASTPAGVVGGLDPATGATLRLPVSAGAQPSDVAASADGLLYVADTTSSKLVRMNDAGRPERSWTIPVANSLDGPHLGFDLFGNLYASDPEGGRVEQRDLSGEAVGAWDLYTLLNRRVKPVGLAVGPDGRIWVTDSEGGAVIVIEPE